MVLQGLQILTDFTYIGMPTLFCHGNPVPVTSGKRLPCLLKKSVEAIDNDSHYYLHDSSYCNPNTEFSVLRHWQLIL